MCVCVDRYKKEVRNFAPPDNYIDKKGNRVICMYFGKNANTTEKYKMKSLYIVLCVCVYVCMHICVCVYVYICICAFY